MLHYAQVDAPLGGAEPAVGFLLLEVVRWMIVSEIHFMFMYSHRSTFHSGALSPLMNFFCQQLVRCAHGEAPPFDRFLIRGMLFLNATLRSNTFRGTTHVHFRLSEESQQQVRRAGPSSAILRGSTAAYKSGPVTQLLQLLHISRHL